MAWTKTYTSTNVDRIYTDNVTCSLYDNCQTDAIIDYNP